MSMAEKLLLLDRVLVAIVEDGFRWAAPDTEPPLKLARGRRTAGTSGYPLTALGGQVCGFNWRTLKAYKSPNLHSVSKTDAPNSDSKFNRFSSCFDGQDGTTKVWDAGNGNSVLTRRFIWWIAMRSWKGRVRIFATPLKRQRQRCQLYVFFFFSLGTSLVRCEVSDVTWVTDTSVQP